MNYFLNDNEVVSEQIFGKHEGNDVDLSIVIPTYKRTELLRKTISSIIRQKAPIKMSYEILIVSNDPEYKIDDIVDLLDVNRYKVYRNKKNIGMVGNMNRCAVLARGKYISYIQDDDILLDQYLESIERLIEDGKLENIDCLIPNRYYFYDKSKKDSVFGEQSYKKERIKEKFRKLLTVGKPRDKFQKVMTKDCADTWYNCFGGGPTCGVLFRRDSLLNTNGFSREFPYAFDFVFFMEFSDKHNVVLFDQYLSVYRMTDSASNKSEVQYDFFRSDMLLLEKTMEINRFVSFFKNEIIRFSIHNKSLEAQRIMKKPSYTTNQIKYCAFRIIRFINLMNSNVYRRELMPQKYYNEI